MPKWFSRNFADKVVVIANAIVLYQPKCAGSRARSRKQRYRYCFGSGGRRFAHKTSGDFAILDSNAALRLLQAALTNVRARQAAKKIGVSSNDKKQTNVLALRTGNQLCVGPGAKR